MYFPYFRGRQYELLALKELASKNLISSKVIPVVEPVKVIPTLSNTLSAFKKSNLSMGLILNPNVGDLVGELKTIYKFLQELAYDEIIIPAILLNGNSRKIVLDLADRSFFKDKVLVILNHRDNLDTYSDLFNTKSPKYTLCPDERIFRRPGIQNRVLFENRFNKQNKNADYLKVEDEFFSDDHLYYSDEGYCGFGDYSIVGEEYIESGFAPYAVAIHIVYFDKGNSLRIRHFISDSNEDTTDVAGKFREAVEKLYKWYNQSDVRQLTTGLKILINHYDQGTYPGLPTLKKLSIMHHLELMDNFLNRRLSE